MVAHDTPGSLAIGKKPRIGNITLELIEALAFQLNQGVKIHWEFVATALCRRERNAPTQRGGYSNLSFLFGSRGFGATVAPGEFLDAPGRIHELLFAGEKGMTSSANTDLNIAARRAGMIHRTACAHHIGFVILWMNTGFHLWKRARNLLVQRASRKR